MIDVSVIIPARNRQQFVTETLRLLADQTFPAGRTEVVLVDDGSTDATAATVRETSYPFQFRYLRLETRDDVFWAARPRNAGLRAASGRIAVLMDSDIFVGRGFVQAHVQAHHGSAEAKVGIGHLYGTAYDNENRTSAVLKPPSISDLARSVATAQRWPEGWVEGRRDFEDAWPVLTSCPAPWSFFWTGNVSFLTEVALRLGGFDEEFKGWGGEDTDLGYRLFRSGAQFQWLPEAWGVHYPHPVRTSMEHEARENCRYILRKYPDPLVEAVLWSTRLVDPRDIPAGVSLGDWRVGVLAAIDKASREYTHEPLRSEVPAAVLEYLGRSRPSAGAEGPTLWLGRKPNRATLVGGPIVHSNALREAGPPGRGDPADEIRVVGLASPWADHFFSLAIAADYWKRLSPDYLAPLVRELRRVATNVALILDEKDASFQMFNRAEAVLATWTRKRFSDKFGGSVTVWEATPATPAI